MCAVVGSDRGSNSVIVLVVVVVIVVVVAVAVAVAVVVVRFLTCCGGQGFWTRAYQSLPLVCVSVCKPNFRASYVRRVMSFHSNLFHLLPMVRFAFIGVL